MQLFAVVKQATAYRSPVHILLVLPTIPFAVDLLDFRSFARPGRSILEGLCIDGPALAPPASSQWLWWE